MTIIERVKDLLDIEHEEYDVQIGTIINAFNERYGSLIPKPLEDDSWYNSYCLILQWEVAKSIDLISSDKTLEFIEKMSISIFNELRSSRPWER